MLLKPKPLTLAAHPPHIAVFNAASAPEALEKMHTALVDEKKSSAVWLLPEPPSDEWVEQNRTALFKNFLKATMPQGNNYACKQDDLTSSNRPQFYKHLLPVEQEVFDALAAKASPLRMIKRFQQVAPKDTATPHFDLWNPYRTEWREALNISAAYLAAHRTRFLLTLNGEGPLLYDTPLSLPACNSNGFVKNVEALGQPWQVPPKSLCAITGIAEWGKQAVVHATPPIAASQPFPRVQCVLDVNL